MQSAVALVLLRCPWNAPMSLKLTRLQEWSRGQSKVLARTGSFRNQRRTLAAAVLAGMPCLFGTPVSYSGTGTAYHRCWVTTLLPCRLVSEGQLLVERQDDA